MVSVAMADRRRSCSPRGAHALPKPPRRASALQKRASACPNAPPAPFASLSPSSRAAPSPRPSAIPDRASPSSCALATTKTHCPAHLWLRRDPLYLLHAQCRVHSRPPFPTERRRRRARSSLQKRAGHLAPSLVVISSTSSTSPSIQLCLGKGEIAVSLHRRHG